MSCTVAYFGIKPEAMHTKDGVEQGTKKEEFWH